MRNTDADSIECELNTYNILIRTDCWNLGSF